MPKHNAQPSIPAKLRVSAEEHIKHGSAPATQGWQAGEQALTLLHTLAGQPTSASDALKLLHELQVHQVELDLQKEQADEDRLQSDEAHAGYVALFDLAPFGYLTVKPDGRLVDVNRMACVWLDITHATQTSHRIDDFLSLDSRQTARDALGQLIGGSPCETFCVQARAAGSRLQVRATLAPGGQLVLMAFMPDAAAVEI